jgi:hypothetical protein
LPSLTFEAVAIEVFAGEMENDFFACVEGGLPKCLRRKLRITTCIVGNGNPINWTEINELACERTSFHGAPLRHGAADRYQLDTQEKS